MCIGYGLHIYLRFTCDEYFGACRGEPWECCEHISSNTNVLSYIRYVHYVYETAFYIQITPFLGKTSIVWHFMPKYHITENITCSWVTKYVLIRRRTNTTRSSRHANKLQYSVEVALTFASGNSHHTKTWVATDICWQSHPMSMKETMSTLSGTNG